MTERVHPRTLQQVRPLWLLLAGVLTMLLVAFGLVRLGTLMADELRRASATDSHLGAASPARAIPARTDASARDEPVTSPPRTPTTALPAATKDTIKELRDRHLLIPVPGVVSDALVGSFDQARGPRRHEAIDILAPRGTPVFAVEDGTIAKLFWSNYGGHTIYQFDPSGRYAYYYAHLDRYADGLAEKGYVKRGAIIGYVGTSGNADPATPHLHFALFKLGPEKRWWEGDPIDPYLVLHDAPR